MAFRNNPVTIVCRDSRSSRTKIFVRDYDLLLKILHKSSEFSDKSGTFRTSLKEEWKTKVTQ